jgi:hypothetical protein
MGFQRFTSSAALAVLATVVCMSALAAAALGSTSPTQTREGYVAQVEPICKTNTKANERILANVRSYIKHDKLSLAAAQFAKASTAFGKATKQIAAVPQPTTDAAKLGKWVGYLEGDTKMLGEIGTALKAEKKTRAQELLVRLEANSRRANNTVLGFEFRYCVINQSKFV